MSKKHFDEYYKSICSQFNRLQDSLEELSEEVSKKIVEPERLEQLQKTIQPIKSSYDMLTYVKYLLDMPARSSKSKRYMKQNKKVLNRVEKYSAENIANSNKDKLKKIKL